MIPAQFAYQRAGTVEEALALLRASDGNGKILAGGHSLLPLMKLRLSEPGVLIDIARIPELGGIREREGRIRIGALTTHHALETSAILRDLAPIVAEAAGTIADPQVRNRGTLGGNLAHADPSADLPAVMLALDATISIQGDGGTRTVCASDFFQDVFTVDLGDDELLTAVEFAPVRTAAYAKLHQRASHYAIVGVAAALEIEGESVRAARVAVTGAASHAQRLPEVEEALAGRPATAATFTAAAATAGASLAEINGDMHASARYRREMVSVFTRRALLAALRTNGLQTA